MSVCFKALLQLRSSELFRLEDAFIQDTVLCCFFFFLQTLRHEYFTGRIKCNAQLNPSHLLIIWFCLTYSLQWFQLLSDYRLLMIILVWFDVSDMFIYSLFAEFH